MLTFHDNGTITGGATDLVMDLLRSLAHGAQTAKSNLLTQTLTMGMMGDCTRPSEREPHGDGLGKQALQRKAQYVYDQSSIKDNNSSEIKNLIVSGAGSEEENGSYVFVSGEHPNRIFATEAGYYQHTNNPSIFIAFQTVVNY